MVPHLRLQTLFTESSRQKPSFNNEPWDLLVDTSEITNLIDLSIATTELDIFCVYLFQTILWLHYEAMIS